MLRVGLTGGIGSGKTTVARIFESLGIPVFYADEAAKRLMTEDPKLSEAIKEKFGPSAYLDGKLNRTFIAELIFSEPEKLAWLNQLIHPATINAANRWFEEQTAPYAIREAALLFESGADKGLDYVIGITAPELLRIERVIKRDGISSDAIKQRMANQLDEENRESRCNFILHNDNSMPLLTQVLELDKQLSTIANEIKLA